MAKQKMVQLNDVWKERSIRNAKNVTQVRVEGRRNRGRPHGHHSYQWTEPGWSNTPQQRTWYGVQLWQGVRQQPSITSMLTGNRWGENEGSPWYKLNNSETCRRVNTLFFSQWNYERDVVNLYSVLFSMNISRKGKGR